MEIKNRSLSSSKFAADAQEACLAEKLAQSKDQSCGLIRMGAIAGMACKKVRQGAEFSASLPYSGLSSSKSSRRLVWQAKLLEAFLTL